MITAVVLGADGVFFISHIIIEKVREKPLLYLYALKYNRGFCLGNRRQ